MKQCLDIGDCKITEKQQSGITVINVFKEITLELISNFLGMKKQRTINLP
jgi:hypothetical protein